LVRVDQLDPTTPSEKGNLEECRLTRKGKIFLASYVPSFKRREKDPIRKHTPHISIERVINTGSQDSYWRTVGKGEEHEEFQRRFHGPSIYGEFHEIRLGERRKPERWIWTKKVLKNEGEKSHLPMLQA